MSTPVTMYVMAKAEVNICARGDVPGTRAAVAIKKPAIPTRPITRHTPPITTTPKGLVIIRTSS
jgi:hypothetical protein